MKTRLLLPLILLSLFSCKKESPDTDFSEARYKITITGEWKTPGFTVPGGAHYTTFIGMVHNNSAVLWKDQVFASPGMEVLAETGGGGPILGEIDSLVAAKQALSLVLFVAPPASGSSEVNIYCNSNYRVISFASMLGPTPDWFVGVSGIELFKNRQWIADTTLQLYAYDAGTEQGDVFGYSNPPTVPQEPIHILQASQATVLANGNTMLAPIATARFIRTE